MTTHPRSFANETSTTDYSGGVRGHVVETTAPGLKVGDIR